MLVLSDTCGCEPAVSTIDSGVIRRRQVWCETFCDELAVTTVALGVISGMLVWFFGDELAVSRMLLGVISGMYVLSGTFGGEPAGSTLAMGVLSDV